MLSLTLADFQQALPFSNKIEGQQIQPFVDLTRTLDLTDLLGYPLLEGIALLPAAPFREYAEGLAITAGDLVARRERLFRAVITAPLLPPPVLPIPAGSDVSGQWVYEPLQTLWLLYVKPYWIHQAFARFLAQHGLDITKAGITAPTDPQGTFTRPASADKAALQAATDSTAEALRSKLTAFLRAEGHGPAPCHAAPSHRTHLRGINRRRN